MSLRRAVGRLSPAEPMAPAEPERASGLAPAGGLARQFWGFTWPRALAGVAHAALQRVDILLVAALAGLTAAATYAVASRFLVLGQLVNQAISQAVQPRLAEFLATGAHLDANRLYQTATGWLVLATWPLYLLIIFFAPLYLGLFGPGYRAGGIAVVILAGAMLVATGCGMVDTMLAMAGRTGWNLANVGLALAINLGANLALIPRYGVAGAAMALALAVLVNNLVPLAQITAGLGWHPFGPGTAAAAALAVGCFGAVPFAVVTFAGSSPGTFGAAVAVGGAGYLFGAYRMRHTLRLPQAFRRMHRTPTSRPKES